MFHCHFLSFFFFSPNFVKGAELSTFEAQFCCILHIYTHTHYYWLRKSAVSAASCCALQPSQFSLRFLSRDWVSFPPNFFPLASRGKKPIKEKAILGKHCWDLTWRNLELFISFEIPLLSIFYFLPHMRYIYSLLSKSIFRTK